MKGIFKVVDVLDLEGNRKRSEDSLDRIGRVVKLSEDDIKIGERLFVECIQPGFMKSFITTEVSCYSPVGWNSIIENGLLIVTQNSAYLFQYLREKGMVVLD